MKKLHLLILLYLVMLIFSSTSFANWKKVTADAKRNTYYLDFNRFKKNDGFFFWRLIDLFKPSVAGTLSIKTHFNADCKKAQIKTLGWYHYKKPMGKGVEENYRANDDRWTYISSNP